MNTYHIADDNGQQRGPYPVDQLAAQGVRPTTLIWAPSMTDWLPAAQVPEVAAALMPKPPTGYPPQPGYQQPQGYQQQAAAPHPGYQPNPMMPPMMPPMGGPMPIGQPMNYAQGGYPPPYAAVPRFEEANGKKIAAGLCAIFLGWLGIHKFVLGFPVPGVIFLIVTLVVSPFTVCGGGFVMWLIALIEGIIYLSKSDQEFYQQYMIEKKQWF